jgi:hypothetical protein
MPVPISLLQQPRPQQSPVGHPDDVLVEDVLRPGPSRRWGEAAVGKSCVIGHSDRPSTLIHRVQIRQLGVEDCGLEFVEPAVHADDVGMEAVTPAILPDHANPIRQGGFARNKYARIAERTQVFGRIEAERRHGAERADLLTMPSSAVCLAAVLDHH